MLGINRDRDVYDGDRKEIEVFCSEDQKNSSSAKQTLRSLYFRCGLFRVIPGYSRLYRVIPGYSGLLRVTLGMLCTLLEWIYIFIDHHVPVDRSLLVHFNRFGLKIPSR